MTNSTIMTNTTYSFPDNWSDLFLSYQPLDMDAFLQSDLFAARRSFNMKDSIANMISGSISFIASMLLIIHILRSHECLSSTYHRLVFGLSAADIISSFCHALSSTMAPKEMSYLVPFASGNIATCDAQGFITTFAVGVSVGYNCSVCFYYLAIITYNKKHDYIKKKLEAWFHGFSILFPLVYSVIRLATNTFNGSNGGTCFMEAHYPPHCIGYGVGYIPEGYNIPCGRGSQYDGHADLRKAASFAGSLLVLIIAPVTILVTMAMMFRSVTIVEKRMQRYGVGSLRLRASLAVPTTTNNSEDQQDSKGFASKIKEMCKCLCLIADGSQTNNRFAICFFRCPHAGDGRDPERLRRSTISNQMASQKRAVLRIAFGYAGAWLLVWTPYFVGFVFWLVTKSYPPDNFVILVDSMAPLQGFFNFVVFMAPKVRTARTMAMLAERTDSSDNNTQNHRQHLTWCQVFCKAYMGKGRLLEDRRIIGNNNRMERSRSIRVTVRKINGRFRTIFERMRKFFTTLVVTRTPSPEVAETNECLLESGGSSSAAPSPA